MWTVTMPEHLTEHTVDYMLMFKELLTPEQKVKIAEWMRNNPKAHAVMELGFKLQELEEAGLKKAESLNPNYM